MRERNAEGFEIQGQQTVQQVEAGDAGRRRKADIKALADREPIQLQAEDTSGRSWPTRTPGS